MLSFVFSYCAPLGKGGNLHIVLSYSLVLFAVCVILILLKMAKIAGVTWIYLGSSYIGYFMNLGDV